MNEYVPIEDGLKNLDIEEDELDEDGDVTPTNSFPTTLTPQTLMSKPFQLSPSSNTSGFFDGDFVRYSSSDEYDMRSNSSLSWGEDEFEGEATRIVNALFDQLDKLLYNEDNITKSYVVPISKIYPESTSVEERKKKLKEPTVIEPSKSPKDHQINIERQFLLVNKQSVIEDDNYESFNIGNVSIPEPSSTLKAECKEWTSNFPHFRITGIGVDIQRLSKLELLAFEEQERKSHSNEDETLIAQDGDYESKLQYVTLKRDVNAEKKDRHRKTKGPPSRICSGSSDPEVLKEQILIKLFDFLWPTVTQVVEPLLNQYAHFVISQSVQYSSLSRESSTKGYREGSHSFTSQHSTNIPPILRRSDRPVSAGIRSPSPVFRLPNKVPTEYSSKEELQKLLQISSKPLLFPENKRNIRSMSASKIDVSPSQTTVVSLPILLNHRPVSSKSSSHLLTPRLKSDQRPSSNSSFARLRFNDKYNALNKTATIEEDKTYDKTSGIRNREEDIGSPSPTWSRHSSFLPPISDVATFVQGKGKGQPRFRGDGQPESSQSILSVKGKSLSASSRTSNTYHHNPQNEIPAKSTSSAEPFVSWLVSKVEQHSNLKPSPDHVSQQNADNKTKHISIDKNKHYKRATHH